MQWRGLKAILGIFSSLIVGCAELPISSDSQFGILRDASQSVLKKKDSSRPDDFSYASLKNKKVESYVSLIGKKLLTSSNGIIDFHILATPYIQGFTDYSGPEIYLTQGMLNTISNEAELAALLGHEIGHIELRHEESEFKDKGRLWDIITNEAENQSGLNVGLSDHRYDIAYAQFEKSKEEKADEFAAKLAAKAGYNPYALCDLFDRLSQNVKDGLFVQIGNLKGSHKSLKERGEHLRKYLTKEGYKQTRKGFFANQYQSALSSLTFDKKQLSLTSDEEKTLAEVASYQKEVERYQKSRQPIPAKRFTHIMSRVIDFADTYHLSKENLLLDSKPYETFMQERLIQKDPLWGSFNPRLNTRLSFLVASLAYCKIGFAGSAPIAAEGVIGTALSAPVAFVGSAAAIGYALHKATQATKLDSDFEKQSAQEFEKSLVGLPPGERVAKVKEKAEAVAKGRGWNKNKELTRKNERPVYTDENGDHYSIDTQHGRFEKCNNRGKHQGEFKIDLEPVKDSQDPSGGHDIDV